MCRWGKINHDTNFTCSTNVDANFQIVMLILTAMVQGGQSKLTHDSFQVAASAQKEQKHSFAQQPFFQLFPHLCIK
jgi:hypothetical protein